MIPIETSISLTIFFYFPPPSLPVSFQMSHMAKKDVGNILGKWTQPAHFDLSFSCSFLQPVTVFIQFIIHEYLGRTIQNPHDYTVKTGIAFFLLISNSPTIGCKWNLWKTIVLIQFKTMTFVLCSVSKGSNLLFLLNHRLLSPSDPPMIVML